MSAEAVPLPAPGVLAPGLGVRPWRHFLGRFDPAERLRLHTGLARGRGGRLEPAGPALPADAAALACLDARALPSEAPALDVLSTPRLLREHFWALDPDELPGAASGASPRWQGFAEEVRRFVAHVRAPVASARALLLTVLDPAEPPGLFETGAPRTLLDRASVEGGATHALHINLADEPAGLVFLNLPLAGVAALLAAAEQGRGGPPASAHALLERFAAACPRYPLVRLTLAPGDGVLVPASGLALDLDPRGSPDLAVLLTLL